VVRRRVKVSCDLTEPRNTLLEEYALATKRYSQAVTELSGRRGIVSRQGYDAMYQQVVDTRNDCDRLRKALAETNPF
jgi:hypothetical protein